MDSEFERFRVNPEVRQRAAAVCIGHGHELSDVLRQVVSHIANVGVIPFEMPSGQRDAGSAQLTSDDERLWLTMKPQLEAEVAVGLLDRFIAKCTTILDQAAETTGIPQDSLPELVSQREAAQCDRASLDVTDKASVLAVLHKYGPLLRHLAGP
jgi:antitoxin component of RelBE/YafQ-DinJ toxin-antitoxin module